MIQRNVKILPTALLAECSRESASMSHRTDRECQTWSHVNNINPGRQYSVEEDKILDVLQVNGFNTSFPSTT